MDKLTSIEEINEALNAAKEKAEETVEEKEETVEETTVENNEVVTEAVDQALETDAAIIEETAPVEEETVEEKPFLPEDVRAILPDQDTLIKTALIVGIAALGGLLFANRKSIVSGITKVVTSKPASFARKALEKEESEETEKPTASLKEKLDGIINKLDSLKRTFEAITRFFSRKKD